MFIHVFHIRNLITELQSHRVICRWRCSSQSFFTLKQNGILIDFSCIVTTALIVLSLIHAITVNILQRCVHVLPVMSKVSRNADVNLNITRTTGYNSMNYKYAYMNTHVRECLKIVESVD